MIKIGGVVYRNIQEQVAKNTQDIAKIQRKPVLQVKKVDELPEEGEEGILYLLPASDPEAGNYFEEYLWIDSAWELIGSSAVDISNMCTTDTEQTITGEKTFTAETKFGNFGLYPADANEIRLRKASVDFLRIQNNLIMPYTDNNLDLGNGTHKFKGLYLSSGINIGTQSTIKNDTWGTLILSCSNGEIKFNHKITPVGNSVDIGSTAYKWKDLYMSGSIVFDTNTKIERNANNNQLLFYAGHSNPAMQITDSRIYFRKSIRPYSNNVDIGGTNEIWHDIYMNGSFSDGTNSVSIADLIALITYAKAQGWIS